MSKKPLYVIVPIYNAQKYLKECLDSLANQSYKDSTFLLVNDGSTDNSEQIAKEYCTKDSRFILINKQNGGTASARNAGLEYVKNKLESNTHLDSSNEAPLKSPKTSKNVIGGGAYIGFVDNDDVISQNYYKNLISILESNDVQIAKSRDIKIFDDENYNKEEFKILQRQTKGFVKVFSAKDVCKKVEVWRGVYDYELIKNLQFQHIKIADDVVFSICAQILAKKIAYTRRARYFYRQHITSTIKQDWGDKWIYYKCFEAIYKFCQKQGGFEYGLPWSDLLRSQAQGFINNQECFIELKTKTKALQIPQNLLDKSPIIKALLESNNAKEFVTKTMSFKEWFKGNFQIRFSRKQNIIKLFGRVLYAGKRI